MKYLRFLLILLLIPFLVLAEECDISKITITSMEQSSIEGNTQVISDPTFEDRTINLDLKMYDVGDSISYDMTIKNDSEEDYMIDEDTFKTDSDYIEYTLKTKDNTNVVKANSTKEVSLIVTYKKEVEDDKLTNNKFNASNTLKLSLNTSEKEQPLDIITTDNIKESLDPEEVKNPVTSVSSMMLISIILLTSIVIIYILIKRKNKYTKYLLIVLPMILIPTVYAICKCDIEVESTIEIEKLPKLFDTVVGLAKEENACVTKYEGEVTDEVGKTVTATNVYFDNCANNRNVIFGGFCWQVVRTTETKGTKLIYNGEPVDGKCLYSRERHKGIVGPYGTIEELNDNYLYGDSFTYNTSTNEFTLIDTTSSTWSDSTYEDLISKYTCKNTSGTCSTIYNINGYYDNISAYISSYKISDSNYNVIGIGPYNAYVESPAMAGYMFNKVYRHQKNFPDTTEYKYGNSFTYDSSTNSYTLSGTTQNIRNWQSEYPRVSNTHYTCWNTTGTCNTISYIYDAYYNYAKYIILTNGQSVSDALEEMLFSNSVNKYSSSVKGIIDAWYGKNLSSHSSMIEDAIYCNSRLVTNMDTNSWNKDGNIRTEIRFKKYPESNSIYANLVCENETDQFSVNNNKAKLTYPIGLIQREEKNRMYIPGISLGDVSYYWELSLHNFNGNVCTRQWDDDDHSMYNQSVSSSNGIRPVISLKNKNIISSGSGSEEDPWIIE